MLVKIKYKRVTRQDLPIIQKLFYKVFKKKISQRFYEWRYQRGNTYNSFVAILNNKIIAHVGFVEYQFFNKEKIFSRHTSFVLEPYRGKNIYTNLLEYAFLFLKQKSSFVIVWPNKLNLKNNIKSKNFFLIEKYFLFYKKYKNYINYKNYQLIKLNKKNFLKNKNLFSNSFFIKNNKYIQWRFFFYQKNNYYLLKINSSQNFMILQKVFLSKVLYYNIVDYFIENDQIEYLINSFSFLKKNNINFQILVSSSNKILIKKLKKYKLKKKKHSFNVGIYQLKKNKLRNFLINNIKNNIKIADTDVFIKTC